ncbi:MAG: hypothetical protein ACLQVA_19295 [Candidatus Brocadiia bacterium]
MKRSKSRPTGNRLPIGTWCSVLSPRAILVLSRLGVSILGCVGGAGDQP